MPGKILMTAESSWRLAFKLLQHFRTHVVCVGMESGPQQRARDTEAHGTKTDDSN
jgi:hypothetical protein